MTFRHWFTARFRAKELLGWGATLLAAFASLATSYGYFEPGPNVKLEDQAVALNSQAPEHRIQFAVTSSTCQFELWLTFATTSDASPSLEVLAIGDNASQVQLAESSNPYGHNSVSTANETRRYLAADVEDSGQFPCAAHFEVIATATIAGSETVAGTVTAAAVLPSVSWDFNGFLTIEPL